MSRDVILPNQQTTPEPDHWQRARLVLKHADMHSAHIRAKRRLAEALSDAVATGELETLDDAYANLRGSVEALTEAAAAVRRLGAGAKA